MATTKARQDLRSKFVRNAIPTEQDFKDLIDAQLNQKDDGIFRNPGEPLSIVAGTDPQKRALRLYGDDTGAAPDWLISLNPGQDPSSPATNRRGFGITNSDGTTRFFIDVSGNVGIGTTNPPQKLSIAGGLNIDQLDANDNTLANGLRFGQGSSSGEGIASKRTANGNRFGLDFYTDSKPRMSITNGGAVGIGTTTPADQLDVVGRVRAAALSMGSWPANEGGYAFIGSNLQDQTKAENYALLVGTGTEVGATYLNGSRFIGLRIGNVQHVTVDAGGNVGIAGNLQVNNREIRAAGNFIEVKGGGNERCYIGGDGAGSDVQIGSQNPSIMNLAAFNTQTGFMNFFCRSLNQTSDAELKSNIEPILGALNSVCALRGVRFDWKSDESSGCLPDVSTGRHIGFIAQEVEKVLPELVADSRGIRVLDTTAIIPLLVESVKELRSRMERLEAAAEASP